MGHHTVDRNTSKRDSTKKKTINKIIPQLSTEVSISNFTKKMHRAEGYFPSFYDASNDKLYISVDLNTPEFLYVNTLSAGVGSNDLGLDRGKLGGRKVVQFKKFGQKLMLVQPNQDYRAISMNPYEINSVKEAFRFIHFMGISYHCTNGKPLSH